MSQPEFELIWKVAKAHLLTSPTVLFVTTPEFELPTIPPTKWTFRYHLKQIGEEKFLHVSLKRSDEDEGDDEVFLRFVVFVVRDDEVVLRFTDDKDKSTFRKGNDISRIERIDSPYYLMSKVSDNIALIFKLKVFINNNEHFFKTGDWRDMELLSKDLISLYKSKILADAVLSTHNQSVKVHKCVLYARCPSLLKYIDREELPEDLATSSETLKNLLDHVYSGHLPFDKFEIPPNVFDAVNSRHGLTQLQVETQANTYRAVYEFEINTKQLITDRKLSSPCLSVGMYRCRLITVLQIKSFYESLEDLGVGPTYEFRFYVQCMRGEPSNPINLECRIHLYDGGAINHYTGNLLPLRAKQECLIGSMLIFKSFLANYISCKCTLICSDGILSHTSRQILSRSREPIGMYLSSDLKKLLMNSEFCDVKLIVYDKEFHVHKSILAARSRFFWRMFHTDGATENGTRELKISDLNPETVASLLSYMYTGETEVSCGKALLDLYSASQMYEVFSLKEKCELYFQQDSCKKLARKRYEHLSKEIQFLERSLADELFP